MMEPRDIPLQVLVDLWRVRWGYEAVPIRVVQAAPGGINWYLTAWYLHDMGLLSRIQVHFTKGSALYQLKEDT